MDSSGSKLRYKVPDELRGILLDFTIAYLLERPQNVSTFGLNFFQRLASSGRAGESGPGSSPSVVSKAGNSTTRTGANGPSLKGGSPNAAGKNGGVPPSSTNTNASNANEPPDEDDGDVDITAPPLKVAKDGRRKSVFAEAYNPEEDEDEEKPKVYPKTDEQKAKLGEAVRNILLFRSLDKQQVKDVIDAMFEKKVTAGEDLIKQGDDGDNFYVIESGKYKVSVQMEGEQPKVVATYDGSGSFGELALMYNMPRAATVQAETDGNLWAMDRQTFRRIVLKNAYKKRQMYENLIESVPMLKQLESYERMNLADALTPRTFSDGETIIKQDDAADGMYFVEDGEAVVVRVDSSGGDEKEINRVSKGGYFGELALLTKKPRAATVKAVGEIKLAFLDVDAFERLLGPCMEIMKRNAADYEQQLVNIFGSKSEITDIR